MSARFRHAAIVGKYQARGIQHVLEDVAQFLADQGLDVSLDEDTASGAGLSAEAACEVASRPAAQSA